MRKHSIFFLLAAICLSLTTEAQTIQQMLDSGSHYLDKKKYEESIGVMSRCIEMDEEEIEAYALRAFAYYHLKNYEKALDDCNMALALNDGYAEMYNLRGLCKDQMGNRNGACNDWHQAYYYGFNDSMRLIRQLCKENTEEE